MDLKRRSFLSSSFSQGSGLLNDSKDAEDKYASTAVSMISSWSQKIQRQRLSSTAFAIAVMALICVAIMSLFVTRQTVRVSKTYVDSFVPIKSSKFSSFSSMRQNGQNKKFEWNERTSEMIKHHRIKTYVLAFHDKANKTVTPNFLNGFSDAAEKYKSKDLLFVSVEKAEMEPLRPLLWEEGELYPLPFVVSARMHKDFSS
jgi:hypothetical protein